MAKSYKAVARHEDEFGLGGPRANLGGTSLLILRVLKEAFDIDTYFFDKHPSFYVKAFFINYYNRKIYA